MDSFLEGDRLERALLASGSDHMRSMVVSHLHRYRETLRRLPPAAPGATLLDIGTLPDIARVVGAVWGYEVRGCGHTAAGGSVRLRAAGEMPAFEMQVDVVDVEVQRLPYATGTFDVVMCCEVLEHLGRDPMNMLWEVNRVLRPSGLLILTTPNVASTRSVQAVVDGSHPFLWAQFVRTAITDRHNREYAPREIRWLLEAAGFSGDGVETVDVWGGGEPRTWDLLRSIGAPLHDRGDDVIAVVRKVGLPAERYPDVFYAGGDR